MNYRWLLMTEVLVMCVVLQHSSSPTAPSDMKSSSCYMNSLLDASGVHKEQMKAY